MKKSLKRMMIVIAAIMILNSICCGCAPTKPGETTAPTTEPSVMPTDEVTVPVPETNIPDPSVDNNSGDSQSRNRIRNKMVH